MASVSSSSSKQSSKRLKPSVENPEEAREEIKYLQIQHKDQCKISKDTPIPTPTSSKKRSVRSSENSDEKEVTSLIEQIEKLQISHSHELRLLHQVKLFKDFDWSFGDLRLKEFYLFKLEGVLSGFEFKALKRAPFTHINEVFSLRKDNWLDPNQPIVEPCFDYAPFAWQRQ